MGVSMDVWKECCSQWGLFDTLVNSGWHISPTKSTIVARRLGENSSLFLEEKTMQNDSQIKPQGVGWIRNFHGQPLCTSVSWHFSNTRMILCQRRPSKWRMGIISFPVFGDKVSRASSGGIFKRLTLMLSVYVCDECNYVRMFVYIRETRYEKMWKLIFFF